MGASSESLEILSAEAVSRLASDGSSLRSVTVSIQERTLNLVFGAPGCGKNTLLRLLGLLEPPDEGEVLYRGTPTRSLSEDERAAIRNRHFGFLFAEPYLLPSFSVVENVAMPFFRISAVDSGEALERTRSLLNFVGLADREQAAVDELSRAAQQRVSLARALVNQPEIVMVEEIDRASQGAELSEFCATLRRASDEFSTTFIVTASGNALMAAMDSSFEVALGSVRLLLSEKGGVQA